MNTDPLFTVTNGGAIVGGTLLAIVIILLYLWIDSLYYRLRMAQSLHQFAAHERDNAYRSLKENNDKLATAATILGFKRV